MSNRSGIPSQPTIPVTVTLDCGHESVFILGQPPRRRDTIYCLRCEGGSVVIATKRGKAA